MTTLLAHRINTLHLRLDAPFPSEVRDGHELVLQWRKFKLRLVPADNRDADTDGDSPVDDGDVE